MLIIQDLLENLLVTGTGTGIILSWPGTTKSLFTGYGNGTIFGREGTGTATGEEIVTMRGGPGTETGTSFSTGTGYGRPRI